MALRVEIAKAAVQSSRAGYPFFWRVRGSWERHDDYVLACGPSPSEEQAREVAEKVKAALEPVFRGYENR